MAIYKSNIRYYNKNIKFSNIHLMNGGGNINGFEFCRKRAGFNSQVEAAIALGVTQGTISQWENGLTHPTGERLRFVAEIYGSTIDELMKKEVEEQHDPDRVREQTA